LESFGGEGMGGNILKFMCLVQFLGGEGREEEGSKIPPKTYDFIHFLARPMILPKYLYPLLR
jgi:hypothetical protein